MGAETCRTQEALPAKPGKRGYVGVPEGPELKVTSSQLLGPSGERPRVSAASHTLSPFLALIGVVAHTIPFRQRAI